ncbi:hypothetical protein B0H12DRAFT_1098464, partial [Mycena haematopus]
KCPIGSGFGSGSKKYFFGLNLNLNFGSGSGIGRTLNLNFAFSSVRFEFEPKSEPNFPTTRSQFVWTRKTADVGIQSIRLADMGAAF